MYNHCHSIFRNKFDFQEPSWQFPNKGKHIFFAYFSFFHFRIVPTFINVIKRIEVLTLTPIQNALKNKPDLPDEKPVRGIRKYEQAI